MVFGHYVWKRRAVEKFDENKLEKFMSEKQMGTSDYFCLN